MSTSGLWRSGWHSLILRSSSVLLTVSATVLLARTLGPEGFGVYAFVAGLVALVGIPTQLGLPTLVVRETAKAHAAEDWGRMVGLWRWAGGLGLGLSVLICSVAALLGIVLADGSNATLRATLFWGLPVLVLTTLGNLGGAAVRGLQRLAIGLLPEMVVRPGTLLVLLAVLLLSPSLRLTADLAMAATAAAAGLALLFAVALLHRARLRHSRTAGRATLDRRRWLASLLPLALIGGLHAINGNTDVVMLGFLGSSPEVGVYKVASQGASLVAFGLQGINLVVAPQMARAAALEDSESLARLARFSARVGLMVALPAVATFVVFGGSLLALLFGADFRSGALVLSILAVGQFVNASFGSVATVLNMTGHERETAKGLAAAATANVLLNLCLIPLFGPEGAAAATVITFGIWNAMLWHSASRRLGISTLAFGRQRGHRP